MRRRQLLSAALGCSAGLLLESARAANQGRTPSVPGFRVLDLAFEGRRDVARRALVLVPDDLPPGKKLPVLVLLHGYAQAHQELRSINAWHRELLVGQAARRLSAPPLTPLYPKSGYLTPERRGELASELARRPYKGLVLACPVTPNPYRQYKGGNVFDLYADWLGKTFLPGLRERAPVVPTAESTGLAGVSMGGYVGLEVMLRQPRLFGAFTGIQSAIERGKTGYYSRGLTAAFDREGLVPLQLITTDKDSYRSANRRLHRQLVEQGVPASFMQPPGHHQNAWVQERGALEVLFWQDRVLSRTGRRGGYPAGTPLNRMAG